MIAILRKHPTENSNSKVTCYPQKGFTDLLFTSIPRTNKMPLPTSQAIQSRYTRLRLRKRETMPQSNHQHPSTPIMLSTSLSDLPTELIVQIFRSVDGFSTATALGSVSHQLLSIWKYFLPSISKTLLSRAIDCFDQAKDLVEAQSRVAENKKPSDPTEVAIGRAKLFFANATTARFAYYSYKHWAFCRRLLDSHKITTAERTSFFKAWYRAITIATIGNDFQPLLYKVLTSMDLLQFLQMIEVTSWLGRPKPHKAPKELLPYIILTRGQRISLYSLQYYLCAGTFDHRTCQRIPFHLHTYILHDHCPENIYSGMEIGLEQRFSRFPTYLLEGILAGLS